MFHYSKDVKSPKKSKTDLRPYESSKLTGMGLNSFIDKISLTGNMLFLHGEGSIQNRIPYLVLNEHYMSIKRTNFSYLELGSEASKPLLKRYSDFLVLDSKSIVLYNKMGLYTIIGFNLSREEHEKQTLHSNSIDLQKNEFID